MPEGQISVVSIPVRNQQRAREFYEEKLGFCVVSDIESGGQRWITLRPKGSSTSITLVTWFKEMKPGSLRGLVLSVPDITEAVDDLRRRGLKAVTVEKAPWGHWLSLEDPDGNQWIIQQDILMESEPENPGEDLSGAL
jgi:catechol 2,3-dioxygenase-like lactoylglutathione lyase family enzyme